MARHKDANWTVPENTTFEGAALTVLMDLRDELKAVNQRLGAIEDLARCPNVARGFIAMNKVRLHLEKHGANPKPTK